MRQCVTELVKAEADRAAVFEAVAPPREKPERTGPVKLDIKAFIAGEVPIEFGCAMPEDDIADEAEKEQFAGSIRAFNEFVKKALVEALGPQVEELERRQKEVQDSYKRAPTHRKTE